MPAQKGDVWVELRLDTKRAEAEIDRTEQKVRQEQHRSQQRARTKADDPSGTLVETGDQRLKPRKFSAKDMTASEREEYEALKLRNKRRQHFQQRAARMRGGAQAAAGRATGAAGRIAGAGGGISRRGLARGISASRTGSPGAMLAAMRGGSVGTLARAAGIGAAIYFGARSVGTVGAPAAEFLEGLTGGAMPDGVKDFTNMVRSKFHEFESNIKALWTAFNKSLEFSSAAARITGHYPTLGHHYKAFQQIDAAESTLDKKFQAFKTDQVAYGAGRLARKLFSGGLSN